MNDDLDVFDELRKAMTTRSNAKAALKHAKVVLRQCEQVVEDIMSEIATGRAMIDGKARPLLDAIHAAAPKATASDGEATNGSDSKIEWTSIDLELVLKAACFIQSEELDNHGTWSDMKRIGCDDRKILEILRAIWPMSARFLPDPRPGCTIRGGATPSFWIGSRRSQSQIPTLSSLQLADRIRRVLEIPRMQVDSSPTPEKLVDMKPPARPRKMTKRSRRVISDST